MANLGRVHHFIITSMTTTTSTTKATTRTGILIWAGGDSEGKGHPVKFEILFRLKKRNSFHLRFVKFFVFFLNFIVKCVAAGRVCRSGSSPSKSREPRLTWPVFVSSPVNTPPTFTCAQTHGRTQQGRTQHDAYTLYAHKKNVKGNRGMRRCGRNRHKSLQQTHRGAHAHTHTHARAHARWTLPTQRPELTLFNFN